MRVPLHPGANPRAQPRRRHGRGPGADPATADALAVGRRIEQIVHEQQSRETRIPAGELDEANEWLRRTQWAEYLQGIPGR